MNSFSFIALAACFAQSLSLKRCVSCCDKSNRRYNVMVLFPRVLRMRGTLLLISVMFLWKIAIGLFHTVRIQSDARYWIIFKLINFLNLNKLRGVKRASKNISAYAGYAFSLLLFHPCPSFVFHKIRIVGLSRFLKHAFCVSVYAWFQTCLC